MNSISGDAMLSPEQIRALADDRLLVKIAEEASEVIKAAMKHAAHGPHPEWAGVQYDNVKDTRTEFEQLGALMDEHRRRFAVLS